MKLYRSKYEAYPFLCDAPDDLRCDFELFTDEMSSRIGLLASMTDEAELKSELLWVCELVYHMNPTLRTRLTVTQEECDKLFAIASRVKEEAGDRCKKFVLTQGSRRGCEAHLLRVKGKALVRLLYRHAWQGHEIPDMLFDLANLLSGYFFYLALWFNEKDGVDEIEYVSRNYF